MAAAMPNRNERYSSSPLALAVAGGLLLVAGSLLAYRFLRLWSFTIDDSFITYRYALHLARGDGLRWNPGEAPVQGFTSLAWVLVNVIPHWLSIDAPAFAKLVGLAAMGASAWLAAQMCWQLLRDIPVEARFLARCSVAIVLIGHPATAIHAASGMETALAALLTTAVAYAACGVAANSGWSLAFTCLTLGLTRPEGNLLAMAALAMWAHRARRHSGAWPWQPIVGGYLVPGAIYFVAQWTYFGLPLPLPFYVKTGGAWAGIENVVGFYLYGLGWLCVPAAAGLWQFRKSLWHVGVALGLTSIFYLYPEHRMGFTWRYLFPYLPLITVASVLGVVGLLRNRRQAGTAVLATAAISLLIFAANAASLLEPQLAYARGLARAHIRLGHDLKLLGERVAGNPLLVIADAGAVPYYSDWRTLDSFGLNDRVIARSEQRDPGYVFASTPEIVTIISSRADRVETRLDFEKAIAAEATQRGYQKAAVYEFGADNELPFGGYYLWVLARADLVDLSRQILADAIY